MNVGLPHNHLLVSAMQFAGLNDASFGLDRLTLASGGTHAMTGPLTEL
jgi:hypothetical protein